MERHAFKFIGVKEIARDYPYSCRYRLEDLRLRDSIRRQGLRQPLVTTAGPVRFLVSGHRRFQAALYLGLQEIPIFEIQGEVPTQDLFLASLFSNWNQRSSELDRAWALHQAAQRHHFSESVIFEEIFPCLDLPRGRRVYENCLAVARLDTSLLELIADGKLPFQGAERLAPFSAEDQKAFAREIAPRVSLTTNQLRQAAEWLHDLLKKEGKGLGSFWEDKNWKIGLNTEDKRRSGEKFCEGIRALRFPRLVDQERKFRALRRRIEQENQELTLEAPDFFEGQGYTLRAKMRTPESLDHFLELLQRKRPLLKSLFDIIL